MRFHLCAAFYVYLFSLFYGFGKTEYILITLMVCGVLALELVNASLERTVERPAPDRYMTAGVVKDMAAGAGWLLLGAQLGASLVCGLAAALFVRLRKRGSIAGRFRAAVACAAQTGQGMPAGRCSVPQKTQPDAVPSQTGFVPAVRDSVNAIVMPVSYTHLDVYKRQV